MTTKQERELRKIQNEKYAAYRHVVDLAAVLIRGHSPYAMMLINEAFKKYEVLQEKENRFVLRKSIEDYDGLLHAMMNLKNIKDVWYSEPPDVQKEWDADTELGMWKDSFR